LGITNDCEVLEVGIGLGDELLAFLTCHWGQWSLSHSRRTFTKPQNHRLRIKTHGTTVVRALRNISLRASSPACLYWRPPITSSGPSTGSSGRAERQNQTDTPIRSTPTAINAMPTSTLPN
jgi:hypothetical protein